MGLAYYYIVHNYPVFVTTANAQILAEHIRSSGITTGEIMESMIATPAGRKAQKRINQVVHDYLLGERRRDPDSFDSFNRTWIKFDLHSSDARDNLYRAIDSWVCVHKFSEHVMFRDCRQSSLGLTGDVERANNYSERWPHGKVYRVVFIAKTGRREWGAMEVEIDTDSVDRIAGTLISFEVNTTELTIEFTSESIVVRPARGLSQSRSNNA